MSNLFEINLTYTRFTSFNHCTIILKFFLRQFSTNYSKMIQCLQVKIRLLIWQLFFHIRVRTSDGYLGMISQKSDLINYGIYRWEKRRGNQWIPKLVVFWRTEIDPRTAIENEKCLDLHDYLSNIVEWIKLVSYSSHRFTQSNLIIFQESPVVINRILEYLYTYLKESFLVNLSGININQLIPLFIDKVHFAKEYRLFLNFFFFYF